MAAERTAGKLGIALLLAAAAFARQSAPLSPDILLLARIRAHIKAVLSRMPDYTCEQTIERSERGPKSSKFSPVDTIRVEVALVNGREVFAWPGAGKFEDRELREMVGGTSGTGSFALHAKAIFFTSKPRFTYHGEEARRGRHTHRFDFSVPRLISDYRVRVGSTEGRVGYHGSFWVDTETLDLMRLELEVDDIPPELHLKGAADSIEYRLTRIGDGEFVLPESSELSLTDMAGYENRNRTTFRGCRQYTGESVVRFGDPPPEAGIQAPKPEPVALPAGTELELRLARTIPSASTVVGEPIAATLSREVRRNSEVIVPKGATVTGRITRFQRRQGNLTVVGITLDAIEFNGRRGEFRASLAEIRNARPPGSPALLPSQPSAYNGRPGEALLIFRTRQPYLPKGFGMLWKVE